MVEDCLWELREGWALDVVASDRERGIPVAGLNTSRAAGDTGQDEPVAVGMFTLASVGMEG